MERKAATWIAAFQRTHGRPPRMLHIGNIANNAYNNAKLLRRLGLECDVLCFDYYHIMATPEWEDADFTGSPRDHFFPDWNDVDLGDFERPEWFVQGPMADCLSYLIATRIEMGNSKFDPQTRAKLLRRRLADERRRARLRHASKWRQIIKSLFVPIPPLSRILIPGTWYGDGVRNAAWTAFGHLFEAILRLFLALMASLGCIAAMANRVRRLVFPLRLVHGTSDWSFDQRAAQLCQEFAREFPDRPDQLTPADLEPYRCCVDEWRALLPHYDIVMGYSTDGIFPLLAGRLPYFAFEHGTLREIPFAPTGQGRMAALTYRLSGHAFVTNADCLQNAAILCPDLAEPSTTPSSSANSTIAKRFTFLNHPYDEDHGMHIDGWMELRQKLQRELRCKHLILFPTRHDWVPGTGYADKANDQLLHAFAQLRKRGCEVGMVCCEWGANVEQSRELLKNLGCADSVQWVEPMGVVQFDRAVRACHVVADQFKLGAFGGVLFKALANGTPVCTYLDEQALSRMYPEVPPVLNCRTVPQIVDRLLRLFSDADFQEDVSRRSRLWMKQYHGGAETAAKQVLAIANVLVPQSLAPASSISPGAPALEYSVCEM